MEIIAKIKEKRRTGMLSKHNAIKQRILKIPNFPDINIYNNLITLNTTNYEHRYI